MRNNSKSNDSYVLHIGALPREKTTVEMKISAAQTTTEAQTASHFALFLWDKIQFVLVSAVVFAVIYLLLNWQAIYMNAEHYYQVWNGETSPFERLVAVEEPKSEGVDATKTDAIPPLNVEVFPTDMRLVIPRINKNVPVVGVNNDNLINQKWDGLEADIQKALQNGVIHYPGTALPGDKGNIVLTGHSSYYPWDPGRFKDVFALLHQVKLEDKIVVYFNQKKFLYQVENIKVVHPQDVDVLARTNGEKLTLITCTPIGTNLNRLVVTAKLISY
jgi:sortase A